MKVKLIIFLLFLATLVSISSPSRVSAFGFSGVFHFLQGVLSNTSTNAGNTNTTRFSDDNSKPTTPDLRQTRPMANFENKNGSRSGDTRRFGTKSGEIKQDVCEIRKQYAQKRREMAGDRITKFLAYLDKVVAKVEEYYTTKFVPAGKTINNYDSLVADVNAKKAALQTAISKAESDAGNINCTVGEIKTDFQNFHSDVLGVESAMRAYRDSIKNLLQAVRILAGTGKDDHTSSSSATKL